MVTFQALDELNPLANHDAWSQVTALAADSIGELQVAEFFAIPAWLMDVLTESRIIDTVLERVFLKVPSHKRLLELELFHFLLGKQLPLNSVVQKCLHEGIRGAPAVMVVVGLGHAKTKTEEGKNKPVLQNADWLIY